MNYSQTDVAGGASVDFSDFETSYVLLSASLKRTLKAERQSQYVGAVFYLFFFSCFLSGS